MNSDDGDTKNERTYTYPGGPRPGNVPNPGRGGKGPETAPGGGSFQGGRSAATNRVINPRAYFLIGAPSTGKTTFRKHLVKFHAHRGIRVLSVDDFVEQWARRNECKFYEAYFHAAPEGQAQIERYVKMGLANRLHLIFDLDDLLTVEERKKYIDMLPPTLEKLAWVFQPPLNHKDRHLARKDHYHLAWEEVEEIIPKLVMPTHDEGFNEVIVRRM